MIRIFKLGALCTGNIFKIDFCGEVSLKALILYLKHCKHVYIFLQGVCSFHSICSQKTNVFKLPISTEQIRNLHPLVPASLLTPQTLPIQETFQPEGTSNTKCPNSIHFLSRETQGFFYIPS